ncbi:hypothetical protein MUY14_07905 [Amycolatopsis sp. FBCC-B4732]|uniref:RHS repeat-associated core domain-containing protein n=1 Tax=Amycolatopsis sp. FBCC-B4732 TaxID=3079339 RepID=UPI001FF3E74B|nr:RHS repeat-associated core domain-containing protein [Amycolatopsis sp. FBCC-B4732]UOX90536.1 hypothetical protein MUY14_07905 [Amycolatopsis sp. FBCC-B4732]
MESAVVGRALRGILVVVLLLAGSVGTAGAVTAPADGPSAKEKERTSLADVAKTPEPQVPDKSWQVDGNGTFTDSIALRVPAFHDITPQFSLAYDSSALNGLAGVGWTLSGLSEIERAGAGKGAPRYDASDVYLADGEELVPCVAGSVSPSCTSGGTHATKNESFRKFALTGTGAASRWTLTAKDGVKRVYAPVLSAGTDLVYRWGLSQVVDPKGNTVTYNWAANQFACCWEYLDSVTYNGTTVKFTYEQRTDTDLRAMGNGGIRTVQGRIKTIDVSVGGSRVRAYKLTYATSDATGRSLLSAVQQFGTDAVLDAAGTVTGGTAMPPVTATYQAGAPAFVSGSNNQAFTGNNNAAKDFPMDINGDGKTDMLELWPNFGTYQRKTWLSDGTDFTLASAEGATSLNENARYLPGDFTGDGKSDLLEFSPSGLGMARQLWVSTGTGFTAGSTGAAQGRNDANARFLPMDVNGDGKTDVLELYSCGIFPVNYCRATWLSDGTTFTLASNDAGIAYDANRQFEAADVNGDGKTDFVELSPALFGAGNRHIWLSTGTGFVSGASDSGISWSAPNAEGAGSRFLMMDVNDDDKVDMVELYPLFGTYTRRTWLSTGYSYKLGATDTSMAYAETSKQLVMDVNGDHRMDMVALSPGFLGASTKRDIWLSTGSGFTPGASDPTMGTYSCSKGTCTSDFLEMDVNGDMRTEMVELYNTNFGLNKGRHIWNMGGAATDVLTSRTNEWGDKTSVSYQPSSAWANTNNPPLTQTVSAVTDNAGPGGAATTNYSYSGGAYHHPERTFLGFRTQRETKPCNAGETQCPYVDTTFRQDLAAIGQAERVENHGGDGALLSSTVTDYVTNGTTVPRTALPTGTMETAYTGKSAVCPGADCKRSYTSRAYNAYGEVVTQIENGDNEQAGDERTTVTTFVPNTAAYIVNKPAAVKVVTGVGAGGTKLSETRTGYDGAAWDQAPAAGYATSSAQWLSTRDAFVGTGKEYDAWGNLTAEIDALGGRTTLGYDPAYHSFQTSETNALSQTVDATWDPVCGTPTRVNDLNRQATTVTYDPLCRAAETTQPGGKFERHKWVDVGDPAKQYEQIEKPAADGTSAPQWSRRYVDGLQRPYRTANKGPDAATGDIYVDTAYNARGQVASRTAPYYWVAGTAQPVTYPTLTAYDGLDRVVKTTLPGGAVQTKSYGPWSTTSTDENGHATTDRLDAYGKRAERQEPVGGKPVTARYDYDLRGNLAKSTDPSGAVITYTTDSFGRQTKVADPDKGVTTYEWDDAGRAVAQTDANNQRTTFTNDKLGRKTAKTTNAGTASATTVSWTYDEVRAGYANVGKVTANTDAAGTRTFDYDALGHTVKTVRTVGAASYEFRYGFDAGDRKLWTTYPDGDTQGTAAAPLRYDSAGRLTAIPGYVTSATYNADGKVTRIANANGTTTTRPHDAERGWLTGIETKSGANVVQDNKFTRDPSGNITKVTSPFPDESWTYTYDDGGRLTSATDDAGPANNQSLTYDAAGNIAANSRTGAYAYDPAHPHAVSTAGANTYTYDAAGNMTSGAGRTLTWNGNGLLASVVKGGVTSTFTYDADDTRLQQVEGGVTRRYLGVDYEVNVTAGTTTKYISIEGTPVARVDGGTKYWVHTDIQGSVQAETDAAGVEVHRKKYRPFGEVLSAGGSLPFESRGFIAERQDSTGLVYLNARYYDPQLGRFISPDPTIDGEDTIGLNRYAYAANDPVNQVDRTGLSCQKADGNKCDPENEPKITRSEIIARAQYWVDHKPGPYYDPDNFAPGDNGFSPGPGDGRVYRRDCSGYVSMAFHLSWSASTYTLPYYGEKIDRSELQAGDILNSTTEHVLLFHKWLDDKGNFEYYSFGATPVKRATANINDSTLDSHANGNYQAYRYVNVVDDPPPPPGVIGNSVGRSPFS